MMQTVILGIETSCDETAAAVVVDGRKMLSNIVSSQIDIHREYGGVVPEIAARKHVESISFIVQQALKVANMSLDDINGIAVSNGPGLVGALLVGLSFAKSLAFAKKLPLMGVQHIYSHICANYLTDETWQPPFICLVVSGGHTHIIEVADYNKCVILARTRDDAVGEAFDKVGRILKLPYPGGPEIDKLATFGNATAVKFPKSSFEDSLDFSFSGLKSAVFQYLQKNPVSTEEDIANIAASFQKTAVDILVANTITACKQKGLTSVAIAGGVAANKGLRAAITAACSENNFSLHLPNIEYCTDNAAMVASGGFYKYKLGLFDKYNLNAYPSIDI
ncbi:MAG: tRNA (adenosine(37)-N6)-threonylcarbamoyltransferase complex transferase subunit TsaD [Firmicutes bacterium]|nr:tRNA (adenosine(37)-N6)-threonylcarbamoyltransferase complex transferase subunit TsaD [Bacillota bacterium]